MSRALLAIFIIGLFGWFGLITMGSNGVSSEELIARSSPVAKLSGIFGSPKAEGKQAVSSIATSKISGEEPGVTDDFGGAIPEISEEVLETWRLFTEIRKGDGEDFDNEVLVEILGGESSYRGKKEFLIVTKSVDADGDEGETRFYIADGQGEILFKHIYSGAQSAAIEQRAFGDDSYFSYFLNFDNSALADVVIRWNGERYVLEVPR